MPYRLSNRRTQDDWYELKRSNTLTDAEIERMRAAGAESWCFSDLKFLHGIGSLDWGLAGSLMFQHFIDLYGTAEEKIRLQHLDLGYQIPCATVAAAPRRISGA
jgi:hypothetical protein